MQAAIVSIIPWFSLGFLIFAAFLTLGVNLLPALFGSRISLAVVGVLLVFGGMHAF
ncbi:MAG: hypothetical protein OEM24_07525 [Paracoccaceae bacterium]|nr:hypothetical protein [Paracoccaceae bacterium]